nr:RNA-directed DNA polymerase, eukaryota [Tanacetum cinerariifolium]
MWGELVFTKDSDDNNLWRKRLCVVIKFEDIIMESFKIIIKGRMTVIRAREIIGWITDFMEEENETSSDSGDEESEKSTPYTDICSGVNGIGSSKSYGKGEMDNNYGDVREETFSKPLQASRQVEKEQHSECNLSSVKGGEGSEKDSALHKGKCPSITSSLLEKMNEFVEIGQAMGFSMDGCVNDIEKLISRKGDGTMLWNYLHEVLSRWKGEVIVMRDFNEAGGQEDLLNPIRDLWKELRDLDALREKDLVQKAKVKWAIEGDENSKYFHGIINKKGIKWLLEVFWLTVSGLWILLRKFWEVIGGDVFRAVKCFFCSGSFPKGCNPSFIALIPKINDAKFVKDFRPISLIGCQYKIVGKILANRLSSVIGTLVSKEQSAVIRGRQILDGPMILSGVIDWCNQKKRKTMIFKVDFEKAYDSVRWDFLDMILYRFGFGDTWRGWIKGCLVSSSASILVNGSPTREFCFEQGLHQGDPLFPFLFLLVMESLHISFVRARERGFFKGIQEGSHESVLTSHLFYADDAVLLGNGKKKIYATYIFFRGMEPGTRKVSWFSWDSVVASKKVGGLGMSRFFAMNCALLFKWIWIFKCILKLCGCRLLKRFMVRVEKAWIYCMKKKVGNGNDSLFWLENWLGEEGMQMEELTNLISSFELVVEKDNWVWNLDGEGVFSVSSARRFIDEGLCVMDGLPTRWLKLIPIKVNVLAWRLASNKLPTRFNMSLRGLEVPSIDFPVCLKGVETSDHLFFSCPVASSIVAKVVGWWGLPNIVIYSYQGWLNW